MDLLFFLQKTFASFLNFKTSLYLKNENNKFIIYCNEIKPIQDELFQEPLICIWDQNPTQLWKTDVNIPYFWTPSLN
jgi:hypothetical protein